MCLPAAALPIAALASGVISGVGAVVSGIQAKNMGKYEQKVSEMNADLDREAIGIEKENTDRSLTNHWRKVARLKGEQKLAFAGGNVATEYGSAAQLTADTDMLAREDADMIARQGGQNVRGLDRSVANNVASGRAARSRGNAAFVSSLFDAGSSVLGGASQYSKLKAGI